MNRFILAEMQIEIFIWAKNLDLPPGTKQDLHLNGM